MEDLSDVVPDVDVAEPMVGPPAEEGQYVPYFDEDGYHDGVLEVNHHESDEDVAAIEPTPVEPGWEQESPSAAEPGDAPKG